MGKPNRSTKADRVEDAIHSAASIGQLERLAGIGQSHDERYAFWAKYSALPGSESLDVGVAELKRLIRAKADQPSQRQAPQ